MGHLIDFFPPTPATEKKRTSTTWFPFTGETISPPLDPHKLWVLSSFSAALRPLNCLTDCWTSGNFGLTQSEGFIKGWVRSKSSFHDQVLYRKVRDDPVKCPPPFNLMTHFTPLFQPECCKSQVYFLLFQIIFIRSKKTDFLSLQKHTFNGQLINGYEYLRGQLQAFGLNIHTNTEGR